MRKCSRKNKSWKFDWCKTDPNPTRFHNTGWDYFRKLSIHGKRERLNKYGICIGFKVSNKTNNRLYTLSCIRQYKDELKNNGYFEYSGKWVSFERKIDPNIHSFQFLPYDQIELVKSCLKHAYKGLAYYNLKYQDDKMIYIKRAKKAKWR